MHLIVLYLLQIDNTSYQQKFISFGKDLYTSFTRIIYNKTLKERISTSRFLAQRLTFIHNVLIYAYLEIYLKVRMFVFTRVYVEDLAKYFIRYYPGLTFDEDEALPSTQ